MDGFDQDEAESKRDERAVILRRLLASKCDTLEAFELDKGIAVIDVECVKEAGELKAESATPDFTEGIEGAL